MTYLLHSRPDFGSPRASAFYDTPEDTGALGACLIGGADDE